MYVGKINRKAILLCASVYEKSWSDEILSNQVSLINTKTFLFRSFAYKWINAEVCKQLLNKHELEIVNG